MLCIAYGILNGFPEWQAIPYASEIGETFADPNGPSFAFMNISKLSNERWQADHHTINTACAPSTGSRNFILEEIRILEPEVIIAMNLGDKIASLGKIREIPASGLVKSYWLDSGGHRCLLIDSWHFSAWVKGDVVDYYVPIRDAIQRSNAA